MEAQAPVDNVDISEANSLQGAHMFHPPRDGGQPNAGAQLLGWPSAVPVAMQSISTPPSNERGHYFRRKIPQEKVPSDSIPTFTTNSAAPIAMKHNACALAVPVVRFKDVPSLGRFPPPDPPISVSEDRTRHIYHPGKAKFKYQDDVRGDAFETPITIDVSPPRPSTSRAVDGVSPEQSIRLPRVNPESRPDHIKNVNLSLKFPNLDFTDRPGLAAPQSPSRPLDPAGDPWPNSIVSHNVVKLGTSTFLISFN
jgi:hypothetical protein